MFTEAQTVVTYDSIFTNDGVGSMDKDTGKWVAGVRLIEISSSQLVLKHDSLNLCMFLCRPRVLTPSPCPPTPILTGEIRT